MKQTVVHSVIVSWPRLILVFLVIGAILFASAIPAASAIESQSTNTGNTISFSKSSSINSSDDLCKILSGSNPDLTFTVDTDDYGDGRYAAFVTNGSDEKSIVGYNKDINVKLDVPAGYKFLVMVRCTNNSSSYATISIDTSGSSDNPPSIDLKGDTVFQSQIGYVAYVYFSDSTQSALICTAEIPDTASWIPGSSETDITITGHRGYTLLWIEILVYSPSA